MKLYHPQLDETIDRNPRQAAVLEDAGWVPLNDAAPSDPEPAPVDPWDDPADYDDVDTVDEDS